MQLVFGMVRYLYRKIVYDFPDMQRVNDNLHASIFGMEQEYGYYLGTHLIVLDSCLLLTYIIGRFRHMESLSVRKDVGCLWKNCDENKVSD